MQPENSSIIEQVDSPLGFSLTACPECDLLLKKLPLPVGGKAKCPRCGCGLYTNKPNSIDRSLAFAVTGLILFFPANFFPIITLNIMGRVQHGTVLTGVLELFKDNMWFVGGLVLLCAVVIPLLKLLMITLILFCLRFGFKPKGLILLFRFYQSINVWGMLEIFLLGVLLSCLKLIDDAEVIFRGGFYCFVGLMMASIMLSVTLDAGQLWHRLDKSLYD